MGYKRWFPVSHDINRDPDILEMIRQFGEKAFRVFMELLSIADRNEGYIPGRLSRLAESIGRTCATPPLRIAHIVGYLSSRRIIVYDLGGGLDRSRRIANWAKYHRTREPISAAVSANSRPPNPPNLPSKESSPTPPSASPTSLKQALDPRIKAVADRVFSSDRVKFGRLVIWIKAKQAERFSDEIIALALERFEPYAKTVKNWYPYLNDIVIRVRNESAIGKAEKEGSSYKDGRMEGLGRIMGHLVAK